MKAKVNVLAKPHPYIFFTLQCTHDVRRDIDVHGIHLAVREHEYLVSGIFTVFIFSRLHCMLPHTVLRLTMSVHAQMC